MADSAIRGLTDAGGRETSLQYMLRLAAPMVVTNISFTMMQFVDRLMVSRLGTEALAAVLPAGMVSFLPCSFAIGVYTSVNAFVSQSLGRGRLKDCAAYCWQGIRMGVVYFVAVIAILWPAAPYIFRAMGHDSAVARMEVTYLRIILYSHLFMMLIWCVSQFFMGVHRPAITMYASLVAQVVNVFANYVLIFGKLGLPAMGIAGAAWGTFAGVTVGAGIVAWAFLTGAVNRRFGSRAAAGLDFGKMLQILRVGLPAGASMFIGVALWGVFLFSLVGLFGKESLAASSAVFSYINISIMPVVGISTALTAAVGKSIGSGRPDLVSQQTNVCLRAAVGYMGLAGVCFYVFRDQLMRFWSSDRGVIAAGTGILICAAVFQIFDAAVIIYTGALRGAGDTVWLLLVQAVGSVALLGAGGLLLVKLAPGLNSLGPWIACTGNVIMVGLANHWRFRSNRWAKIDIFKRQPGPIPLEVESIV
jgi:MATE family multidrug resistance protein